MCKCLVEATKHRLQSYSYACLDPLLDDLHELMCVNNHIYIHIHVQTLINMT